MMRLACAFAIAAGMAAASGTQVISNANADDKHDHPKPKALSGTEALAPFKALAGEWTGKMDMGDKGSFDVRAVYKVTSNGSAVVETLGPDTPFEMVTVIHPDGDKLVLTHYCASGNQPRMKTAPKPGTDKVKFKFTDITNLKSPTTTHMHDVTYTFVSKDQLKADWTHFENGKAGGHAVFDLKRKK
jgi:hypothetical protein